MKKLIQPDRSSVAVDAFVQRSLRTARMRAGLRTSAVTVGLALSVGSAAAWSEEPRERTTFSSWKKSSSPHSSANRACNRPLSRLPPSQAHSSNRKACRP